MRQGRITVFKASGGEGFDQQVWIAVCLLRDAACNPGTC
jgi:hypothetical protein